MKQTRFHRLFSHFLIPMFTPILAISILLFFLAALSDFNRERVSQGREQLEAAIIRAAVTCYASEGIYPPDLSYLEAYYGVQINKAIYSVQYEPIGSNLMPDITVLEKETGK